MVDAGASAPNLNPALWLRGCECELSGAGPGQFNRLDMPAIAAAPVNATRDNPGIANTSTRRGCT